ncbi:hypothetical protein [Brevibacillus centrosporus]|uniref:hypothetical protein n=1 Tax=Brevibacillus centrosporus TaxID=54910 RepID=UPI002E24CB9F|nr:hypothetical protein [Brevibacillus centrosporus]
MTYTLIPKGLFNCEKEFNSFCHDQETDLLEVSKISLVNGEIDIVHSFPIRMSKVSIAPSGEIAFGAELRSCGDFYEIALYRMDLKHLTQNEVGSIFIGDKINDVMESLRLDDIEAYPTYIFAVDNRYSIIFIAENEPEYGKPYFQHIYLIDSKDNKVYQIENKEISNNDTLLRLGSMNSFNCNGNLYFYLKTGRINASEKKELYLSCNHEKPYYDHLETLLLFSVSSLSDQVHGNVVKLNSTLIEQLDYNYAFDEIGTYNDGLYYEVLDIGKNSTTLKQYNISEKVFEKKKTVIESLRLNAKINENEFYEKYVAKLQSSHSKDRCILELNQESYLIYLEKRNN